MMSDDFNPRSAVPQIGWWVTFCCDCDATPITDQDDINDFLQCPVDEQGERQYWGEPCDAYPTVRDLVEWYNTGLMFTENMTPQQVTDRCQELYTQYNLGKYYETDY